MKRSLSLIILISLILILNSVTMINALEINGNKINFDITPEIINDNSYVPLNQFNKLEDFLIEKLQNNRFLIIYNGKYFIISTNDKMVKSSQGEFTLNSQPLSLNNHLLVPLQLINKIFNGDDIEQEEEETKLLKLKITTDQKTYKNKDNIELNIEIINNSNQDITLEFNSGQKYDIFIKNKNDEIIYSWAENQMFIQAFVSETINANSSIVYNEIIEISDLSQGSYSLAVQLTDQEYKLKSKPIQIEIN